MADFRTALEALRSHTSPEQVAGFVGVLLSLRYAKKLSDVFFYLLGGVACVVFLAPWLVEQLDIDNVPAKIALYLIFGLVGLDLLTKFVDWVKSSNFWTVVWTIVDVLRGMRPDSAKHRVTDLPKGDAR